MSKEKRQKKQKKEKKKKLFDFTRAMEGYLTP